MTEEPIKGLFLSFVFGVGGGGFLSFAARTWLSTKIKGAISNEYKQKMEVHKAEIELENKKSLLDLESKKDQDLAQLKSDNAKAILNLETERNKLLAQFNADNEKALMNLRSEINDRFKVFQAAQNSFAQMQIVTTQRKLDAIDKLWDSVLQMRTILPSSEGWDLSDFAHSVGVISPETEHMRPYIGEYLWALFAAYRAIGQRLFVISARNDGEHPKRLNWFEDKVIQQITQQFLTDKEQVELSEIQSGRFRHLQKRLEAKILFDIRRVISGERSSKEALAHAARILREVASIEQTQLNIGDGVVNRR